MPSTKAKPPSAERLDTRFAASNAVAVHCVHYNFARVHKTLRVTPAMEAGLANHVWSIEEIVGLLDRRNAVAA